MFYQRIAEVVEDFLKVNSYHPARLFIPEEWFKEFVLEGIQSCIGGNKLNNKRIRPIDVFDGVLDYGIPDTDKRIQIIVNGEESSVINKEKVIKILREEVERVYKIYKNASTDYSDEDIKYLDELGHAIHELQELVYG